jgi:hypothetical protein
VGLHVSDWIEADQQIIKPLVKSTAAKYAADKKLAHARLRTARADPTASRDMAVQVAVECGSSPQ